MKKIIKIVLYGILVLVAAICIAGLVLAYWPTEWKITKYLLKAGRRL
jgi:hypothetical protein